MIEHRLIEKMLGLIDRELETIEKTQKVNPVFIDTVVDFIRTYADRTHHGKEEDILFKELGMKKLNSDDSRIMRELVDEHILARNAVSDLVAANNKYIEGNEKSIDVIIEKLTFLINFYPKHIIKEDKVFFPDTERYFTDGELNAMLNEFNEFDKRMIHEKYNNVYESLLKKYS